MGLMQLLGFGRESSGPKGSKRRIARGRPGQMEPGLKLRPCRVLDDKMNGRRCIGLHAWVDRNDNPCDPPAGSLSAQVAKRKAERGR